MKFLRFYRNDMRYRKKIPLLQGEFKTSVSSPITLGHEFSGKIVALGEEAKDHFMVGDKVAVDPNRYTYSI